MAEGSGLSRRAREILRAMAQGATLREHTRPHAVYLGHSGGVTFKTLEALKAGGWITPAQGILGRARDWELTPQGRALFEEAEV